MRKDKLYFLGTLVLVAWLGMTYFIFIHGPKSENRISDRAGFKLKKEIDHFEKRLKAQIKENALLLLQLQELRSTATDDNDHGEGLDAPAKQQPTQKFVDGANEYDVKLDLNKDTVDAEQSGTGGGRNAAESVVVQEEPVVTIDPHDVMPVLMFACNRITVTKALDLVLKYRTNRQKFPIIVSQVTYRT